LFSSERYNYNAQNCGSQCPIMNQLEISCVNNKNKESIWQFTSVLISTHY